MPSPESPANRMITRSTWTTCLLTAVPPLLSQPPSLGAATVGGCPARDPRADTVLPAGHRPRRGAGRRPRPHRVHAPVVAAERPTAVPAPSQPTASPSLGGPDDVTATGVAGAPVGLAYGFGSVWVARQRHRPGGPAGQPGADRRPGPGRPDPAAAGRRPARGLGERVRGRHRRARRPAVGRRRDPGERRRPAGGADHGRHPPVGRAPAGRPPGRAGRGDRRRGPQRPAPGRR